MSYSSHRHILLNLCQFTHLTTLLLPLHPQFSLLQFLSMAFYCPSSSSFAGTLWWLVMFSYICCFISIQTDSSLTDSMNTVNQFHITVNLRTEMQSCWMIFMQETLGVPSNPVYDSQLCLNLDQFMHGSYQFLITKLIMYKAVPLQAWTGPESSRRLTLPDSKTVRQVWWLRNHWNTFFGQKFVHGDGSVTGSIVVMLQHPSVRNLWPDTMNPFSESWTVWRFKFNTMLIILTAKRRSDLTRSLTLVKFSSVFDVQGIPQRGSSSTLSRQSKNALCHLKTCVLDRACSP